jgi:hypothetical protein
MLPPNGPLLDSTGYLSQMPITSNNLALPLPVTVYVRRRLRHESRKLKVHLKHLGTDHSLPLDLSLRLVFSWFE